MNKKVAVFGLGSMGSGVARSLLRAGFEVHGFDVVADSVERFVNDGGHAGDSTRPPAGLGLVVSVVLNAAQTEAVLFGDGAPGGGMVARLEPGSVVVSCATVAPGFARHMATRCEAERVAYLDAPISGGAARAKAGRLTVLASGSSAAFERARPALDAMAETVFPLGEAPGLGSAMKAVNQLLAGVHIAAMGEAMVFGMSQGIEPGQLVEVISRCAGTSWMFENRAPHVVDGDYTPRSAVDIWLKDLAIVLDIAKDANLPTPLAANSLMRFIAAAGAGLGAEDDAAVAKIYARECGVTLP